MSAISKQRPRADDPRVMRSRAAAKAAGRTLFLQKGYAGATMEEIAALAGLSKRTLYYNYADKNALFTEIVTEVTTFAEAFTRDLPQAFAAMRRETLPAALEDLAQRQALGILRPEVIAMRRLLIGEAREFPALAADYFDRAPGRVMDALADGFALLHRKGFLRAPDPRRAAAQFGYLVVGEPLDRALLGGEIPPESEILAGAHEGVRTFLARYAA